MIKVERVDEYSAELLADVNKLLPSLSSSAVPLDSTQLKSVLESDSSHLFLASEDGRTLGMLTLLVFQIPTGVRAWIEDVVVSEDARNKGAGRQLVEAASLHARGLGAKTVDLTSRPTREAANQLYQKCGFQKRETNVYRLG